MCELFAMSSRQPATVNFSLEAFAQRGGLTGPHRDGWGIAYYEDEDVRCIREPGPAANSPWVRFVEAQGLRSTIVISHIRKATAGLKTLKNTQPYCRELGGRMHVFAHNGDLAEIERSSHFAFGFHRPIGSTDSEIAFCALLHRLEALWLTGSPTLRQRLDVVARFAADLRPLGPANFLYSDGELIVAHGHRRTQKDGLMRPPGLFALRRECDGDDGSVTARAVMGQGITITAPHQQVLLIASVPLTEEAWRPLEEGEVVAVSVGRKITRVTPREAGRQSARGHHGF